MGQTIMQNTKKCYITGRTYPLHKHHCIPGFGTRSQCEKYGLWVWLTPDVHYRVHNTSDGTDLYIRQQAQRAFEKTHTREEWHKIFGRSYLDD